MSKKQEKGRRRVKQGADLSSSMDGGLREVSVSLVFSVWCLLLLLRSQFLHSSGDPGPADFYSERGNFCKVMPLEFYLFPVHGNSCSTCQSSGSPRLTPESDGEDAQPTDSDYVDLDEFRRHVLRGKENDAHQLIDKITHRLEPDGAEYNYASSSKGAKVLAHNKEAKGAANILGGDKDKYLRNPCSADQKFVVFELSEETLVDTIEIANREHYSSNFKDFELFGSLRYPTETWELLGKFTAENAKHAHRFVLPEPKWTRYMKLKLVSHYGSEFYCTLSYLEVYGVDAVERMLQDFIAVPDEASKDFIAGKDGNDTAQVTVNANLGRGDSNDTTNNASRGNVVLPSKEVKQQSTGRIHSDAVLKILMQKMRSLELSLSTLEEYTKVLNQRYGAKLPDLNTRLTENANLLEKIKIEVHDLVEWKENVEKDLGEHNGWKSVVSIKVDALIGENAAMRSSVDQIKSNQEILENKELAVLSLSLFFACLAFFKLACDRIWFLLRSRDAERMCGTNKGWLLILTSSTLTTLIVLLYN